MKNLAGNNRVLYPINALISLIVNGLFPVIPLFAIDLGLSKGQVGVYVAFSYTLLLSGSLIGGYIFDRKKNPTQILTSTIFVFCFVLLGASYINSIFKLIALTGILSITAGVINNLVRSIFGSISEQSVLGKKFGKLSISSIIGAIAGAALVGFLLKKYEFVLLFRLMALLAVFPLIISLNIKYIQTNKTQIKKVRRAYIVFLKTHSFFFLSCLFIAIVNYIILLSVPLLMDSLAYSKSDISFVIGMGILFSIPVTYYFSYRSDFKSRLPYLILVYVSALIATALLIGSSSYLTLVLVMTIKSVLAYTRSSLSLSYVRDISNAENFGRMISLFESSVWIGGVIGYLLTGFLIESSGFRTTFFIGLVISILALFLLVASYLKRKRN